MPTLSRGPQKPGYLGAYNWKSTVLGIVLLAISNVIPTQYLANYFAYQPVLGEPLFIFGNVAFYQPFKWALWLLRFSGTSNAAIRQPMLHGALLASIGIMFSLLTVALMNMFHNRKLMRNTEDLHGSARWAEEADLRETGLLTTTSGVYVGGWTNPKTKRIHYLKHDGPEHIIALAPTRSGKGISLVVPSLLSWKDSVVVYDIKGENWAKTAGFRQASGQLCLKFAPVEQTGSRFNPLAEVRIGTAREVSDAQNLAEMLCRTGKEGPGDEHWVGTAVSLITGLILHVCYEAKLKNRFGTLSDLSAALTPFKDANRPDETPDADQGNPVREHFEAIKAALHDAGEKTWTTPDGQPTATHPVVAEKLQEMLNREDREFSSVLSTAKKALTLYSDPLVARNVAASDFSINDLVNFTNPVSLYIVVPPSDKVRLKPLLRLMFTMIVNRLTEKMDFVDGKQSRNKHRLLLMIDEFPTLGNMAVFADALAYMAGYGLKAYLIAQDMGQIIEHYTRNESIISNCHIRVAFAPNKIETAEMLSKMTGTTTVQRAAMSFSGARSSSIMSQVSQNVEHVSRPLMTVDEVSRLPSAKKEGEGDGQRIIEPGAMLIFVAGSYPVLGTQILYFKDKELLRRSEFPMPTTSYVIDHKGDIESEGVLKLMKPAAPVKVLTMKTPVIVDATPAKDRPSPARVEPDITHAVLTSHDNEEEFDIEEDQKLLASMSGSAASSSGGMGLGVAANDHDLSADEPEFDYNHDDEQNDDPDTDVELDEYSDHGSLHGDDADAGSHDHMQDGKHVGAVYER